MKLGPDKLDHKKIRWILKRKRHKSALRSYARKRVEWSGTLMAEVKKQLRLVLRDQQDGRCIYCRRKIKVERRNAYEDIEHFLDKSKPNYRKWAFSCVNLAIACHACNLEKGTKDLSGASSPSNLSTYPTGAGAFRWIHPYFDAYHQNVEISRGWTYRVKNKAPARDQAKALIEELKLAEIARIEAHSENIKLRIERLTVLARRCMKNNKLRLAEILLDECLALQQETTFG